MKIIENMQISTEYSKHFVTQRRNPFNSLKFCKIRNEIQMTTVFKKKKNSNFSTRTKNTEFSFY